MAVSPWSASFRSTPGYAPRPSSTAVFTPPAMTVPSIPSVPAIDDARAPNAPLRQWLAQQLPQLGQQHNANLTLIRAGAKQSLAGYGGWTFGTDDPDTPEREDLLLSFDPSKGPGEREKQAVKGERSAANARNMLYSSFANQNIASAVQRLSLEAQQIANQYAQSIMRTETDYGNQVSGVIGQWVGAYGADSAWLAEHPPPPPPPGPNDIQPTPPEPGTPGGLRLEPGTPGGQPIFEIVRNPPASQIAALKKRGYKKAGAGWGPNVWVLKVGG